MTMAALEARLARLGWEYQGTKEFEDRLFVPGPDQVRDYLDRLASAAQAVEATVPTTPVAAILTAHWQELVRTQVAAVHEDLNRPYRYLARLAAGIVFLVFRDSRPLGERARLLAARTAAMPAFVEACAYRCRQLGPGEREHVAWAARTAAGELERALAALADWDLAGGLYAALNQTWADVRRLLLWLASVPADDEPAAAAGAGPDDYARQLEAAFGISVAELLSWREQEVEAARARVAELAGCLRAGDDARQLLQAELPPYPTPEAMFAAARDYLAMARQAARPYLNLPADEQCRITEVPETARDSFPWGGYAGGCPHRRPLLGEMFLNQANFTAVTRGWLQMMAIHEAYPGHHAQWVHRVAGPGPDTAKLPAHATPLLEGAAHRSEELLQHIYPDRAFPLFVAYRRLHTALRVTADLELHYHRRPAAEVCRLYEEVLGFDPPSARAQVTYQERNPGYMTCYYYGHKVLCDLERGFGWGPEEFTRLVFSAGPVSLRTLRALLEAEAETRAAWLAGRIL